MEQDIWNLRKLKEQNMKIRCLVTGSEGFIGSHLVEKLLEKGYQVRAFVLYNSFSNIGWLSNIKDNNLEIYFGDIKEYQSVLKAMNSVNYVFHLAALISIPYSYSNPEGYVDTNVIGTFNVLEASRNQNNIERVIITSTSEVYGSALYTPMDEKHPMQAQSPYAASKISADRFAESYYKSYDLPVTIVRPFNTYGPRQSTRAIIPRIITQLINNPQEVKLGSLYPIRDFNYVADVVDAFVKISETTNTLGKEINISTGIGISIQELIETISKIMKIDYKLKEDVTRIRPEKSEVDRLIGDSSVLRDLTGWISKFDLEAGLKETILFYMNTKDIADEDYII